MCRLSWNLGASNFWNLLGPSRPVIGLLYLLAAAIAQSVLRLATGRTVRGSRFPAPVQTGPGAHPASYTMGNRSFPGVKRPGPGADPHSHFQCRGLKKGRAIPLPTLRALVAYKGTTFTFTLQDIYEVFLTAR